MAHGSSLYGVPWQIKARKLISAPPTHERKAYLQSDFSIGDPGNGVGYGVSLPLPLSRNLILHGNSGSDLDEYPESDLSGVTVSRVVTLDVMMNDGVVVTVEPTLAPPAVRARFPWLRAARFYDAFFPAVEKPQLVTAFDRSGKVLGRSRSHRGVFFSERGR